MVVSVAAGLALEACGPAACAVTPARTAAATTRTEGRPPTLRLAVRIRDGFTALACHAAAMTAIGLLAPTASASNHDRGGTRFGRCWALSAFATVGAGEPPVLSNTIRADDPTSRSTRPRAAPSLAWAPRHSPAHPHPCARRASRGWRRAARVGRRALRRASACRREPRARAAAGCRSLVARTSPPRSAHHPRRAPGGRRPKLDLAGSSSAVGRRPCLHAAVFKTERSFDVRTIPN